MSKHRRYNIEEMTFFGSQSGQSMKYVSSKTYFRKKKLKLNKSHDDDGPNFMFELGNQF
jgi:hypothetical protein